QRMPVTIEGPPFVALCLRLDPARGEARVELDDGSLEAVQPLSLGMSERTGRFEATVREGRAQAVLSRGAHQALLEHVEDRGNGFALRVGDSVIPIRT